MTAAAPITAHVDRFAQDNLPPIEQQPEYLFDLPGLQFPERLNAARELLDRAVEEGRGARACIVGEGIAWSCADLQQRANRIANVLVKDMGLVPGNRVLLRAPNNPMLAACWFGVIKAGGIAVGSMPLLRAKELAQIVQKAQISHALCDARLDDELEAARPTCPSLRQVCLFNDTGATGLEARMAAHSAQFDTVDTAATDICLMAFTSGTTGAPKGTMHFHRDLMAACVCWPQHVLRANADDIFIGSPPLAFTFGLGGLLLFPLSIGASTVLVEQVAPAKLLDAAQRFRASVMFTAPTSYRAMALAAKGEKLSGSALRKCVSAGEALPAATRALWHEYSGMQIIDGIGSTEMLHIFISSDEHEARAGATGKVVPGYVAAVLNDDGQPCKTGEVGALVVKGPTGCRYLADPRQRQYVRNGWNYTGDAYHVDEDGYFHFDARTDDMIVTAGYNIAGPEVEDALLLHPQVAECAVIGVPDEERGQIVKAFVVLKAGTPGSDELVRALQEFVKSSIAPYKYPRAVEFRERLPRTETGKLQRFRLRENAA